MLSEIYRAVQLVWLCIKLIVACTVMVYIEMFGLSLRKLNLHIAISTDVTLPRDTIDITSDGEDVSEPIKVNAL